MDPDVAPVVDQGIRLLMPLLEAAGRRAWSGPAPVRPSDRPAPDKWARIEIADQGKLPSFSRGDLERTARSAFATAIACSKSPPPPYLPSGANVIANSNANGAWTQRVGDELRPVDAQGIKMKVDTRANQKKVPSKLLLEKKTGSVVAADV